MIDNSLKTSILITTRNRADLFRNALASAVQQSVNNEIVVVDDGSVDETIAIVNELAPSAKVLKNFEPAGIIQARNQGFEVATGDIVFTLDDDAVFGDDQVVEKVSGDFKKHPFVGAVSIPIIDHFNDGRVHQRLPIEKPSIDFLCTAQFSGGANAIRRSLFLSCGKYKGKGRQGEERGVCLRLLEFGYIVKVAEDCHIDHYPQSMVGGREFIDYWNIRNSIDYGRQFIPFPHNYVHTMGTCANHLFQAVRKWKLASTAKGIFDELIYDRTTSTNRQPVGLNICSAFRNLSSRKLVHLSELNRLLNKHNIQLIRIGIHDD